MRETRKREGAFALVPFSRGDDSCERCCGCAAAAEDIALFLSSVPCENRMDSLFAVFVGIAFFRRLFWLPFECWSFLGIVLTLIPLIQ